MAQQYITLEEAAQRLGLPTDEFKRRLKTEWTHIQPMRDGPTLRFRVNQVDELARQLGAASDPGLPLADMEESAELGSDDFKISPLKTGSKPKRDNEPLHFDSSDDDIFSLSTEDSKVQPKPTDESTDSDVRLELAKHRAPGKDDAEVVPTEEIALDVSGPGSAVIKGGSSAKLQAPKSSAKLTSDSGKKLGESGKKPADPGMNDSSEFELSLDADSDDFELQLNTDSSDEVDLGSSPVEEPVARSGKSGVNLRNPADSGVSLEKGKKPDSDKNFAAKKPDSDRKLAGKKPESDKNFAAKKPDSGKNLAGKRPESDKNFAAKKSDSDRKQAPKAPVDDSDDFELSLDTGSVDSAPKLSAPSTKSPKSTGAKPASKPPVTSDSDSEFELTLDDSGEGASLEAAGLEAEESKGDIFETDFEIPPMTDESGSEAVAIDSDTDLEPSSEVDVVEESETEGEESGSQVVLLDDEDETGAAAGDVDLADVEAEDEGSAATALAGVKGRRRTDDDDDDDEESVPSSRAGLAPLPWGPIPALVLFPAFILVMVGGLMSYELMHTMMGYQQPRKPTAPLVRGAAKALDMELKDQ